MLVWCWPISIVRIRIRKMQPISCESSQLKTSTLRLKLSYNWCSTIIRWLKHQISQEHSLYGTILLRQGMGIAINNPVKSKKVKKKELCILSYQESHKPDDFLFYVLREIIYFPAVTKENHFINHYWALGKSIQQMTGIWLNECFSRLCSGYHLVYNPRLSRESFRLMRDLTHWAMK